jgi:hypothetical protein
VLRFCLLALCLFAAPAHAATDWQLAREDRDRNIQVFVRGEPGQPYHAVYALTRLQVPASAVLAVLQDVPAAPEWVVRVSESRLLRREGDQRWVYSNYQLPYPFLARDAVLHSVIRHGAGGVVSMDTVAVPDMVPLRARHVRLTGFHSLWTITPEANGWVKVELWGEGNPGGYIPSWLFNYSLPDEPVQTLRNLRRMALRPKYQPDVPALPEPQKKASH